MTDDVMTGVVGIDLSLTSTGVARLRSEAPDMPFVQAIATKPDKPLLKRWEHIAAAIIKVVDPLDRVFIEDYAWGITKGSALVTLAEIGGLVRYILWKRSKASLPPVPVNIQTVKQWVGVDKKDKMRVAVYKKWKREYDTDDEVDAFLIADFGWHLTHRKALRKLTTREEELIARFLKKHDFGID